MIAQPVHLNIPDPKLAESPYWDVLTQCLYWTDIKAKLIHCYNPANQTINTCHAPRMAAFVFRAQDGGLITGLEDGIYQVDFETEKFDPIALISEKHMRLNDGKCDPSGRIWFGTIPLDEKSNTREAKLYCFTNKIVEIDNGFGIANGKAWTPKIGDTQFFYHIDTIAKIVWRYVYDAKNGGISDKQEFIRMKNSPDGMCVDSLGNLYIAMYDDKCVDVYSSAGKKQYTIEVPAEDVTSCAFGGADLKTLYITTATTGLFHIELEIAGVNEYPASIPLKSDKD